MVVTTLRGVATGNSWVKAKDGADHPITHGLGSHDKGTCPPNINSAAVENTWHAPLCPTKAWQIKGYLVKLVELKKKKDAFWER